jgi:hypothetical protein
MRFLDVYDTVNDFDEAMKNPTPAKIQIAAQVMPHSLGELRNHLTAHVRTKGVNGLSLSQMRAISLILGTPVSPQVHPQYLQRLQAQAQPPPPQPAKPVGAGLGVHGAQAVTMRDAPESLKLQLGGTF